MIIIHIQQAQERLNFQIPLAQKAQNLAQLIYLSGIIASPVLCLQLGTCGLCKVKFLKESTYLPAALEEEEEILGRALIAQGWRLACKHEALGGMQVELPPESILLDSLPLNSVKTKNDLAESGAKYLAIDFGSTHIQACLHDVTHKIEKFYSVLNPQLGAGSEIMSRLAWAENKEGSKQLQALSVKVLQKILENLPELRSICLAANSAMVYLLLGKNIEGLIRAPYTLDYRGGKMESVAGLPEIWVAPLISPFVGGDITAGYAYLLERYKKTLRYPFILADMGTNGEFLLALNSKEALVSSLPLGPALEGVGMACGSVCKSGSIIDFKLTVAGLEAVLLVQSEDSHPKPVLFNTELCFKKNLAQTEADSVFKTARGVSASAYFSLLDILLKLGLINESGAFVLEESKRLPRAVALPMAKALRERLLKSKQGETYFYITDVLYLSSKDVEELLKIKASFSLILAKLLAAGKLKVSDLENLYIGGALGEYTKLSALINLGLIPQSLQNKVVVLGNSSLKGAMCLATSEDLKSEIKFWSAEVKAINFLKDDNFLEQFILGMSFKSF